eukprot:CFRG6464T1
MTVNFEHDKDQNNFLEEILGEKSLEFVNGRNEHAITALGDPKESPTYSRVLAILDSKDKIPRPTQINAHIYNFWTDENHKRGLWRRTTLKSYQSTDTEWETVLDVDALGEKEGESWVWKGYHLLEQGPGETYDLCLLSLSRGGADATVTREFSLSHKMFLSDLREDTCNNSKLLSMVPFNVPEAKSSVSYKGRDVVLIGTNVGKDSQTDSGYPRTIMEWRRGTELSSARALYTGEKTDVAVSGYISDQRGRGGCIYEWRHRSITFYTSTKAIRKLTATMSDEGEFSLSPCGETESDVGFQDLCVPDDASCSLFATQFLIKPRSEWLGFPAGSLLAVDVESLLEKGADECVSEGLIAPLFVPSDNCSLDDYTGTNQFMIVSTLEDVKIKLVFWKWSSGHWTKVGEENEALIRSASCRPVDSDSNNAFWFTTSGFTQPSKLFLADVEQHGVQCTQPDNMILLKELPQMFNAEGLEVQQFFATSTDGTQVPYFIVGKKPEVMDGSTPTLLYGYGGFEVSLTPSYASVVGSAWLERGGCFVEANIRGGGEYGPKWHRAALKENRQLAYDDFIAVATDLIKRGITSSERLAIRGGSNGGLLMGNMLVQQPKGLWGAVHCAVPLLDMRRFHKLLAGASWMAEYGNPDTEDWENFLHKYSPYHILQQMTTLRHDNDTLSDDSVIDTPILFTTSTRDDRVHPGHARKMVKALIDAKECNRGTIPSPVYYYENIEGGHGGAADNRQQAFMQALAYDFLWNTVGN